MKFSATLIVAVAAHVSAHGVITEIQGANGVVMPGLSVIDGTPRDCTTRGCGAQDDSSIIREEELGTDEASALGRNEAGPVDAAAAIARFMGGSGGNGAASANKRQLNSLFTGGRFGGGAADDAASGDAASAGTETPEGTVEEGVAKAAGSGATSGLPTCGDDGTITMTFHQVNRDGAGPLTAQIDPTSGGTDPDAFETAEVTTNVPGNERSRSDATTTDFPVTVQMPQGMTCSGSAGGADNVCVVRLQNSARAGPFGGSAAFTMSTGAKKRAIEYNLRKREAKK